MNNDQEYYINLWNNIFETLKKENTTAINKQMEFSHFKNNVLYINAFSEFKKGLYENQYSNEINKILKTITNENIQISFIVDKTKPLKKTKNINNNDKINRSVSNDKINNYSSQNKRTEIINETKTAINNLSFTYQDKQKDKRQKESNLSPKYTFDSFIMGENTALAYNIALAISKEPGIAYNPCLIYGNVGLGKTHLLQSVGNYIVHNNPRLKVIYVTAENFTNEFISAVGDKSKINQFKYKYRKVDVLLIDDIHFLQNKEGTQEELFHTFNDLYETKRQMVFTCDRPIQELQAITDRLKNRFTRGINVDLRPPEYETKVKIIRVLNEQKGNKLSEEIIDFLCQNVNTNVRDLESCFNKLEAYKTFFNTELTIEKSKELLETELLKLTPSKTISIDKIIRSTCDFFQVSLYDIKSKKRNKKIVNARQAAMYLSRDLTNFSTTEIGSYFNRDHTTIMHAVEKIENMKSSDQELEAILNSIKKIILSI